MAEESRVPVQHETRAPSPWVPFESLRREIDRIFDSFRQGTWDVPFRRAFERDWPALREAGFGHAPAVDFAEKGKEYEITAELPGLDEKDIEVKLANRTLTIKGEKKEEKEEREKNYYFSERRYGSFMRSFQVPEGVDADKIEASFSKGLLTIKLPKSEQAQKAEKKIEVKGG